jgi:hypothetical protein
MLDSIKHKLEVNVLLPNKLSVGAIGAEFLKAFKGYIENPTTMML